MHSLFREFCRCRRRVLELLLLALLSLFSSSIARGHQTSDSYLDLSLTGSQLAGEWHLAIGDLDAAIDLDDNGDGEVTWGELQHQQKEVLRYALDRLRVKINGRPLSLASPGFRITNHLEHVYAVLEVTAPVAEPPRFVQVDYGIFFETYPLHRGFFFLEHAGETLSALFNIQTPGCVLEIGHPDRWATWLDFVKEGVWHIWIGFDHILFLLALLLPSVLTREGNQWRAAGRFREAFLNVLKVVTAFTLAHSLTLALAAFDLVRLPSRGVEAIIAASVAIAALHNLYPVAKGKSWIAAFVFGLIHGFGFANVLAELGTGSGNLALVLTGFNAGVELGQLAIVAVFLPLAFLMRGTWLYRTLTLQGGSALIAVIAGAWMMERIFDLTILPF